MNDLIKSLTNPFAERAKSPLIGSFVVSWCLFNWRIIYLTLFLSNETIAPENKLDYVGKLINGYDGLLYPLISSLVYIFIYPYLDKLILMFTESRKREKIDEKIRIGRHHSVNGNLYYDLKLRFEEEKMKILNADSERIKLEAKLTELQNENQENESKIQNQDINYKGLELRLQNHWNRNELKDRFQGRWKVNFNDPTRPNIKGSEEVEIKGYNYIIIDNNREIDMFDIKLFDYDIERKKVSFVKFNKTPNGIHLINELNIISNDRFEGTENGTVKITYERRIIDRSSRAKNDFTI